MLAFVDDYSNPKNSNSLIGTHRKNNKPLLPLISEKAKCSTTCVWVLAFLSISILLHLYLHNLYTACVLIWLSDSCTTDTKLIVNVHAFDVPTALIHYVLYYSNILLQVKFTCTAFSQITHTSDNVYSLVVVNVTESLIITHVFTFILKVPVASCVLNFKCTFNLVILLQTNFLEFKPVQILRVLRDEIYVRLLRTFLCKWHSIFKIKDLVFRIFWIWYQDHQ